MDHQLWLLLQLRDESFQWIVYVPGEGDNIYEVYDCNQPTEFLLEDEQCGGACQIYPDCFEFRIVSLRSRLIIEIPYYPEWYRTEVLFFYATSCLPKDINQIVFDYLY